MGSLCPERPRPWPQREAKGLASVSLLPTGPGSMHILEVSLCDDPSWAGSALSLGVPTGPMSCEDAGGRAQQGENGALAGSGPDHTVSVLPCRWPFVLAPMASRGGEWRRLVA